MKYLLVLLAALFTGCSVGVTHQTEDADHTEKSSAAERSRTTVAVGILNETTPRHEPKVANAIQPPSAERSKTTVTVNVTESSSEVIMTPLPPAFCRPDRVIQVAGNRNTVTLGDVHIHHHEHFHVHQAPKLAPVRINVRVEDRISDRERRRRMVETRIGSFDM